MSGPAKRSLWRISRHDDLQGLGGERADGRWHTAAKGKRTVYLSEHPALALMEVLANLKGNPRLFPGAYRLMKIAVPHSLWNVAAQTPALPGGWRDNLDHTRNIGDLWLAARSSALLIVPSAPAPESSNLLLNPLHPDAHSLVVEWSKWVDYDKRLFHLHDSPK